MVTVTDHHMRSTSRVERQHTVNHSATGGDSSETKQDTVSTIEMRTQHERSIERNFGLAITNRAVQLIQGKRTEFRQNTRCDTRRLERTVSTFVMKNHRLTRQHTVVVGAIARENGRPVPSAVSQHKCAGFQTRPVIPVHSRNISAIL